MHALTCALAGAISALVPAAALAVSIDFETGFSDNEALTATSFAAQGVVFSTINEEEGLTLDVEAVGTADSGPQGFVRDATRRQDEVDPGLEDRIGTFFLRTGGEIEDRNFRDEAVFRISYDIVPYDFISGEIWDIDGNASQGTEKWRVDAFDALGVLIGSVSSPTGVSTGAGSLDGDVWTFAFNDANVDGGIPNVAWIDFSFIGTKTRGLGLAFDNFTTGEAPPAIMPLPGGLPLLAAGLGLAAWSARRRQS
ncbi:MAG: hypothetical protein AAGB05_11425 [Pseudomonadota bacterium]